MRTLYRYLLWLLIAALPLQGGAAAFMSCASLATASQAAAAQAGQGDQGDQGGQAMGAQGALAHGTRQEQGVQHAHCGQAKGGQADAASPHGKCSHCASCFAGSTAPPSVPVVALPATFSTFAFVAGEPAMSVHIPATLERPPRSAV